jgi:hypothetical protein
MASKSMILATLAMISIAFVGGMSVVGLLQSNERLNSSGIVTQPPPPLPPPPSSPPSPPPPPPPEPTIDIDVYSDSACTQPISSVVWGSIEAGDSEDRVVYVKNTGDDSVVLGLGTDNWSPGGAEDDLHLSWDYGGGALSAGAVVRLTLTLDVDSSAGGIDDFSFDIVITGSAS